MTQPTDTATTAAATDPTTTTAAAATDTATTAASATTDAAQQTAGQGADTSHQADNPWADPAKAQAEIERLRRENAAARTNAKQQAAEEARTQLLKDLGLVKDDTADKPDPAKLSQDIADRDRLLAVYQHAPKDVDVQALMDRVSFRDKIKSIDATDTAALAAAIGEAVTADPRLKATPGAAPVGGAQQVGGGSAPARVYTREQLRDPAFFAANRADILRAQSEGRIRE